jgi:pimeloyl-ACP methyl ester carboxylesterase
MSLGALIADAVALCCPERVASRVQAGGIAGLSWWARVLMHIGRVAGRILPYILLYQVFAWIIMPGVHHARTRRIFAAHAVRLGREEFLRWYRMCSSVSQLMKRSAVQPIFIPTLFVMGANDYMFCKFAVDRARIRKDTKVIIIPDSGHVCSIERPNDFNDVVRAFLNECENGNSGEVNGPI